MKILGIDPGSIKMGYGLIEIEGRHTKLIESGVIKFNADTDLIDRLSLIFNASQELFDRMKPDVVSLESLIFAKSVPSMAKLAQARGAIISALGDSYQGRIFEYAPTLVKSTVTGHGNATKEGVQKTLQTLFGREQDFITHDASDAVAIALCHSLHMGQKRQKVTKTKGRSLKSVFANWE